MSRIVVGSKPFSRKSFRAEVRMFSRVASRLESLGWVGMFERVQNIGCARRSQVHSPQRTRRSTEGNADPSTRAARSLGMTFVVGEAFALARDDLRWGKDS